MVVGDDTAGAIGSGMLVLLGAQKGDGQEEMIYLADKMLNLRIFEDENGKMNRSLLEVGGDLLVVSQFTLLADCRKGRRPSFFDAMEPQAASAVVGAFVDYVRSREVHVEQGIFGAMMNVTLTNDGPVTILLDSRELRSRTVS